MGVELSVAEALAQAGRSFQLFSDTAYLDAQVLLAEATHRTRAWLLAHGDEILTRPDLDAFLQASDRYRRGEALPYILGWWEFYGRRFELTPQVLIPRPETELMLEIALDRMARMESSPLALDVGTGSGCIAITLALECPHARIMASDLSEHALRVAQMNARRHHVAERIRFLQGDLVAAVRGPIDLLCANLPYVPSADVSHLIVGDREPRLALDGGPDGMALLRRLILSGGEIVRPGGRALLEVGADQGARVLDWVGRGSSPPQVSVHQDLAGHERVVELTY
jgi:release factor glutamine methyltransferase